MIREGDDEGKQFDTIPFCVCPSSMFSSIVDQNADYRSGWNVTMPMPSSGWAFVRAVERLSARMCGRARADVSVCVCARGGSASPLLDRRYQSTLSVYLSLKRCPLQKKSGTFSNSSQIGASQLSVRCLVLIRRDLRLCVLSNAGVLNNWALFLRRCKMHRIENNSLH